jgi:hypothetical protein
MNGSKMSDNLIHLPGCQGKKDVPSDKEKECLMKMKAIKERVRELKAQAKYIEGLPGISSREKILEIEGELQNLKKIWNDWEEKRLKAEKERMIILGHEKADGA